MIRKKILALGNNGRLLLKGPDGREEPVPVPGALQQGTAYLLIDCSESMAGEKLKQARRGAVDFIRRAISKGYGAGLIAFDDRASVLVKRTSDPLAFEEPLASLDAAGTTNMTGAFNLAYSLLADIRGARFAVVISDGTPDDRNSAAKAARKLASIGVQLITIATASADTAFLAAIATARDLAVVVAPDKLQPGIAGTAHALPLLRGRGSE